MRYALRMRLDSFLTGAATASSLGIYILYKDYMVAHESITQQAYRFSSFAKLVGVKEYVGLVICSGSGD
ncbi:hypothetical protein PVK06_002915 [Gossypium arboreum]|uniref:Uncharacterized protein n=1 Tax=Gossypium arboreum TaxID=29729 RepID=A0ABR0R603_GOSAR|nr:hypothetical protein PVK06_002915 [Gossypium arboreum]